MVKVKLATASIGISPIDRLKTRLNAAHHEGRVIVSRAGTYLGRLPSAIALACTDPIMTSALVMGNQNH